MSQNSDWIALKQFAINLRASCLKLLLDDRPNSNAMLIVTRPLQRQGRMKLDINDGEFELSYSSCLHESLCQFLDSHCLASDRDDL